MSHVYDHRNYIIFDSSNLNLINFDEVLEDSINTVRKSLDDLKVVLKWEGDLIPPSVAALPSYDGIYNHDEVFTIMNTLEWSNPDIDI